LRPTIALQHPAARQSSIGTWCNAARKSQFEEQVEKSKTTESIEKWEK
jgi:hypothetical protein